MSGYWNVPAGFPVAGPVPEGTPFSVAGEYWWIPPNYGTNTEFSFAARGAATGDGGTIQLWGELGGARVNIGSPIAVTQAAPVIWPSTFFADGRIGITLSALTGAVVVETAP